MTLWCQSTSKDSRNSKKELYNSSFWLEILYSFDGVFCLIARFQALLRQIVVRLPYIFGFSLLWVVTSQRKTIIKHKLLPNIGSSIAICLSPSKQKPKKTILRRYTTTYTMYITILHTLQYKLQAHVLKKVMSIMNLRQHHSSCQLLYSHTEWSTQQIDFLYCVGNRDLLITYWWVRVCPGLFPCSCLARLQLTFS